MDDKSNPVEEFLKEAAEVGAKHEQELQHLQAWKDSGHDPEYLRPLLAAYQPLLDYRAKQWKAPHVPEPAFRAELQTHLVNAFKNYDPSKGAQLRTHVEQRIQKAKRFNATYQNSARMSEGKSSHIGTIDSAKRELFDLYGREPTHQEIATHINNPKLQAKQIRQIEASRIGDIAQSSFEEDSDPTELTNLRSREILRLLPYELTPHERTLFNHMHGLEGHEKITSKKAIAEKMGKSPSDISRLTSSILKKYNSYR